MTRPGVIELCRALLRIIRQIWTAFACRMRSKFVKLLGAKFVRKDCRRIRQHFQINFDKMRQPLTKNFVKCCRILLTWGEIYRWKMRSKNLKLLCRIISKNAGELKFHSIFSYYSTLFLVPGATLFVKYQTNFLS